MLALIIGTAKMIDDAGLEQKMAQERFDRIVANAEYLVNYGLVVKGEGGKHYPNWIAGEFDANEIAKIGNASGLLSFGAAFDSAPTQYGNTCIYRLIVYGEAKQPRKIYFCGEG
jgi:hypothetical protein